MILQIVISKQRLLINNNTYNTIRFKIHLKSDIYFKIPSLFLNRHVPAVNTAFKISDQN